MNYYNKQAGLPATDPLYSETQLSTLLIMDLILIAICTTATFSMQ